MSGVLRKKPSKDNRKESAKRSLQREETHRLERFMTEMAQHKVAKATQSSTNSPFINKTLTPKLKGIKVRPPLGFSPTASPDSHQKSKRWDLSPVVNSYQKRAKVIENIPESTFLLKTGAEEVRKGRGSHKETSINLKKRESKPKKQSRTKKQSKLELITQKPISKTLVNKENFSPNLPPGFEASTQSLLSKATKLGTNETTNFQMFSKFLKSMDLQSSNIGNLSSFPKGQENQDSRPTPSVTISETQSKLLLSSAALLTQIRATNERDQDPYELIREYVDQSQMAEFRTLNFLLSSSSNKFYTQAALSLKLERWAVMTLFYFRFTSKISQIRIKHVLKDMLEEVIENLACVLAFLKPPGSQSKRFQPALTALSKAVPGLSVDQMTEVDAECLLRSNNAKIQDKVLVGFKTSENQELIEDVIAALKCLPFLSLTSATERCFEIFYTYVITDDSA